MKQKNRPQEDDAPHPAQGRDICFARRGRWLRTPPVAYPRAAAFMAHGIVRNPRDLRLHAQRIHLLIARRERAALFGALIDLFIALGGKGGALRRRLLQQAAPLLDERQRRILENALADGLAAGDPLTADPHARLSAGRRDPAEAVEAIETAGDALPRDALAEARDLIDGGMIDAARRLLETRLLENPGDAAASRELLALYRHSRNEQDFHSCYKLLRDRPLALRDEWLGLAEQLSQWRTEAFSHD